MADKENPEAQKCESCGAVGPTDEVRMGPFIYQWCGVCAAEFADELDQAAFDSEAGI